MLGQGQGQGQGEGVAASGEGMRITGKRELESSSMAIANEQQEQWLSPDNGREGGKVEGGREGLRG